MSFIVASDGDDYTPYAYLRNIEEFKKWADEYAEEWDYRVEVAKEGNLTVARFYLKDTDNLTLVIFAEKQDFYFGEEK